jgi:hypothetical protein
MIGRRWPGLCGQGRDRRGDARRTGDGPPLSGFSCASIKRKACPMRQAAGGTSRSGRRPVRADSGPDVIARELDVAPAVSAVSATVARQDRRRGEAQIDRDGARNRQEIGIDKRTDPLLDALRVDRLDMVDHRLRRGMQSIFGGRLYRHPQQGRFGSVAVKATIVTSECAEKWSERSTRNGQGLPEGRPIEAVTTAPRFNRNPASPRRQRARTHQASRHHRGQDAPRR